MANKSVLERFVEKVNKTPTCWLWMLTPSANGYGNFYFKGKGRSAHRMAFELFKGPIPEGLQIRHTCDVPTCVNPDHLMAGTGKDNMLDKSLRGRWKGNQKLTIEQVLEIKRLLSRNVFCRVIAKQFGVHEVTIGAIKQGRNWRKIP